MKRSLQFSISIILVTTLCLAVALAFWRYTFGLGRISIRTADGATLVSHDEILSVDWDTRSYQLSDEANMRLAEMHGLGLYFRYVIYVDDHVVSSGNFVSMYSSYIPFGPNTYFPRKDDNKPIIMRGNPVDNRTLHKSLWYSGKLD